MQKHILHLLWTVKNKHKEKQRTSQQKYVCGLFYICKIHIYRSEQEMHKVFSGNHRKCVKSLNPFQKYIYFLLPICPQVMIQLSSINTTFLLQGYTDDTFYQNLVLTYLCLKTYKKYNFDSIQNNFDSKIYDFVPKHFHNFFSKGK